MIHTLTKQQLKQKKKQEKDKLRRLRKFIKKPINNENQTRL